MTKTIKVARVLEMANRYLASEDTPLTLAQVHRREGVASLLSSILHETGNYAGFSYLDDYWLQRPVFTAAETGAFNPASGTWTEGVRNPDCDESRVHYFCSRELTDS